MSLLAAISAIAAAAATPAPAGPDLSGTWRMEMTAANTAKVPLIGDTLVVSKQLNLATITPTTTGWRQNHQACDLRSESTRSLATTRFPPGFVAALPVKSYDLELTATDGKWAVAADLDALHVGYDPDIARVPPDRPDAPGVIDWDHDGKPGATVLIDAMIFGTVELYLVQTSRTLLDGFAYLDPQGQVTALHGGLTLFGLAMHPIGATNRLFMAQPKVTFTPSQSGFSMTRVPDGTTCADLLEDAW